MRDRILFFMVGCVVGFIIGYLIRTLKDIKDTVDEVDNFILNKETPAPNARNESIKQRLRKLLELKNIALFLVVALTAYSAFASQRTSNQVERQQEKNQKVSTCTQQYLAKTIAALNARTTDSEAQGNANIQLQNAQLKFLSVYFVAPPATVPERIDALKHYVDKLKKYAATTNNTNSNVTNNPFPETGDFTNCLNKK